MKVECNSRLRHGPSGLFVLCLQHGKSSRLSRLLTLTLLPLSTFATSVMNAAFAAEFEVQGEAIYDLYDGRNLLTSSRTNTFQVSVRGAEWDIIVYFGGSSNRLESAKDKRGMIRTIFCQYNGEATNRGRRWSNSATIREREVPIFDSPFLGALWLAYCSPPYLMASTNGMIETIWTQDNPNLRQQGFRQAAKWVLNEAPPYLPVELFYLSDGTYHGYDRLAKKPTELKVRPPYDSGYTNATYFAHSFTNLSDDCVIPMEIYFRTSRTPLGSRTTPDLPRDTLIGNVRSVSSRSSMKTFVPKYEGEVSIFDFTTVAELPKGTLPDGNVRYKQKNGAWP